MPASGVGSPLTAYDEDKPMHSDVENPLTKMSGKNAVLLVSGFRNGYLNENCAAVDRLESQVSVTLFVFPPSLFLRAALQVQIEPRRRESPLDHWTALATFSTF